MAAGINLRVDTGTLKNKSQELQSEIGKLETQWRSLGQTIAGSRSYWEGDASELHQKYYNEMKDDVEEILKRLKEHPTELLRMAGIYDEAENKAKMLSGILPDNVIV